MKKFIFIVLFFIFYNQLSSQDLRVDMPVHKYLTFQAWELTKMEHPEVVYTMMHQKMKNPVNGNYGDWWSADYEGPEGFYENSWNRGKIMTGAAREDLEDPVFEYCGEIILSGLGHPYVTASHFWDADY